MLRSHRVRNERLLPLRARDQKLLQRHIVSVEQLLPVLTLALGERAPEVVFLFVARQPADLVEHGCIRKRDPIHRPKRPLLL
eukprot:2080330-Prymnesium_polylepis.1